MRIKMSVDESYVIFDASTSKHVRNDMSISGLVPTGLISSSDPDTLHPRLKELLWNMDVTCHGGHPRHLNKERFDIRIIPFLAFLYTFHKGQSIAFDGVLFEVLHTEAQNDEYAGLMTKAKALVGGKKSDITKEHIATIKSRISWCEECETSATLCVHNTEPTRKHIRKLSDVCIIKRAFARGIEQLCYMKAKLHEQMYEEAVKGNVPYTRSELDRLLDITIAEREKFIATSLAANSGHNLKEYNTIAINLGRQRGHTAYIAKNAKRTDVVFCADKTWRDELKARGCLANMFLENDLTDPESSKFKSLKPERIYADGFSYFNMWNTAERLRNGIKDAINPAPDTLYILLA